MSKPRFAIKKLFSVVCPDCGEKHEDVTWRSARNWIPKHRLSCKAFQTRERPRKKTGDIVECPICHVFVV